MPENNSSWRIVTRRQPSRFLQRVRCTAGASTQGARLVTRGPYALIRHPMYTALLVTTLLLVLAAPSLLRAAVWLLLLVDLVVKLNYEEGLLVKQFAGYAEYRTKTHKLLPWLY